VIGRLAVIVLPDCLFDIYGNLDNLQVLFNTFLSFLLLNYHVNAKQSGDYIFINFSCSCAF